jgi:hypothetical protein
VASGGLRFRLAAIRRFWLACIRPLAHAPHPVSDGPGNVVETISAGAVVKPKPLRPVAATPRNVTDKEGSTVRVRQRALKSPEYRDFCCLILRIFYRYRIKEDLA